MSLKIALTFTGSRDPFHPSGVEGTDIEGPILSLLGSRAFDKVILISTNDKMAHIACETQTVIKERKPDLLVDLKHIQLDDPTDYFLILAGLRKTFAEVREENVDSDFYIGTASGTPQMHACWLMLVASGEIPARLLQTRPQQFVTDEKPPVTEIDPTSGEFPTIRSNTWSTFSDETDSPDLADVVKKLGIIGDDPEFKKCLETASNQAAYDIPILIGGESGTGKEQIAQLVHNLSKRSKSGELVTLNCSAIPNDLAESVLFGHRKGSFTGAIDDSDGKFKAANGGTIFLDEVGELPLHLQPKLLRVLEQQEIEPVGGKMEKVDVRIISATNRDLEADVGAGRFREDLYYRLNVGSITLPPLRNRPSDITKLALVFLDEFSEKCRQRPSFAPESLSRLQAYYWPGNIRQLRNMVQRAAVSAQDNSIQPDDLKFPEDSVDQSLAHLPTPHLGFSYKDYESRVRSHLYDRALEMTKTQAEAARFLSVSDEMVSKYKRERT